MIGGRPVSVADLDVVVRLRVDHACGDSDALAVWLQGKLDVGSWPGQVGHGQVQELELRFETGRRPVGAMPRRSSIAALRRRATCGEAAPACLISSKARRLPAELVRVIEFLNEQMSPAEVLGVGVQQYTDGRTSVLVPRTIGATAAARVVKDRATGTPWNSTTFLVAAAERGSQHEVTVTLLERLLEHAEQHGSKLSWGKGVTPGVSGWYSVATTSRAVWTANAGTGSGTSKAYVYLYLPELNDLLPMRGGCPASC
jgi:hypothetical protein